MRLWDALRGQRRPKRPNLDNLFALPGAAITLQTSARPHADGRRVGLLPGSRGRRAGAAETGRDGSVESDSGPVVERSVDDFGFTWLVVRGSPEDVPGLVTDLHAVNTELETQGFASGLLCSTVGFADAVRTRVGLVYLYKQGTFYPFAPNGPQSRDVLLERQVRDLLTADLTIEPDLGRWMPLWGAPGL